ncbi:restriction endonuclease [Streptomyces sp. NBC_01500]|uniref:restriction endonuclease n=1 Tax=Streptomyces sp. NBC_01500 TaxID=2903886 RepID=UPI00225034FC|nr:restriction endonuclease [Streptomyces sp. NBC_01500]MCX4554562.1 restriction endonuclease [Streptomyces sp. NBC_01500]
MSGYTVLYDPDGLLGAELPLDREPHMALAKEVLGWEDMADVERDDCLQIALQLTGHGRAVADDVRRLSADPAVPGEVRELAEVVLREADRRLSSTRMGTVHCVQQRARMVRALYERLDRLNAALPAATSA